MNDLMEDLVEATFAKPNRVARILRRRSDLPRSKYRPHEGAKQRSKKERREQRPD